MDKSTKKVKVKQPNKITSSGREIKRPRYLLTTSSDEAPNYKKPKISTDVQNQIIRLKSILSDINKEKKGANSDKNSSENSSEGGSSNILVKNTLPIINSNNISADIPNKSVSGSQTSDNSCATSTCLAGTSGKMVKELYPENVTETLTASATLTKPKVKSIKNLSESQKIQIFNADQLVDANNTAKGISRTLGSTFSAATELRERTRNANSDSIDVLWDNGMNDGDESDRSQETFGIAPSNSFTQILECLKKIKKQNKKIIEQNSKILGRLPDINSGDKLTVSLYEPLNGFPLSTMDRFDNLEDAGNKEKRKQMYHHLLHLGSSKVREFLNVGLKQIMTDELVAQFNWLKSDKSREFGNTKIANVLFQAAKDCPLFRGPSTKAEFKEEMLEVLRSTKQRFRKSSKKPRDEESIEKQINRLQEMIDRDNEDATDDTGVEEDEEFADDET